MVRHSGFLTSLAAVLLAVLSVSVLERRSDGCSQNFRGAALGTIAVSPRSDRTRSNAFHQNNSRHDSEGSTTDLVIRFPVPQHSLIIVGSLDTSGAAHLITTSSTTDERINGCTSVASPDCSDLEYLDTAALLELQSMFHENQPCRLDRTSHEVLKKSDRRESSGSPSSELTRRFLIPHFELDQVVQQPSEASLIAEGHRVKVYTDVCSGDGEIDTSRHQKIWADAHRVCSTIEIVLLPLIERWIGRISDLDGDQHLSIVMSDLDRRKSPDDAPILGCVRRGDFAQNNLNSLAGDIVYLDRDLPSEDQLRALLAHELTHAAIYCIPHEAPTDSSLKNHSVPAWLNEAAAHWVERQFCTTPAGFATREAAFRRRPAVCPIMMRDDNHHLATRRTGGRVAGVTFLQQHLADVRDLRHLLEQCAPFEQSISEIAETPFSQLFRQWAIHQTCGNHEVFSPMRSAVGCSSLISAESKPVQHKLHGTAFLTLRSEADTSLTIEAHRDARLQITVLHQADSRSTHRSPNSPAAASLQSAGIMNPLDRLMQ